MRNARRGPLRKMRTTQVLIRLRIRAGWSRPSLPSYRTNGYCDICRRTENVQLKLHGCALSSRPLLFIMAFFPLWASNYKIYYAPQLEINIPSVSCLIRLFVVYKENFCIFGCPKCAQWRFWSGCANAHDSLGAPVRGYVSYRSGSNGIESNQSTDTTGRSIISECRLGKLSWTGTILFQLTLNFLLFTQTVKTLIRRRRMRRLMRVCTVCHVLNDPVKVLKITLYQ